jgi:hypothetical protein
LSQKTGYTPPSLGALRKIAGSGLKSWSDGGSSYFYKECSGKSWDLRVTMGPENEMAGI